MHWSGSAHSEVCAGPHGANAAVTVAMQWLSAGRSVSVLQVSPLAQELSSAHGCAQTWTGSSTATLNTHFNPAAHCAVLLQSPPLGTVPVPVASWPAVPEPEPAAEPLPAAPPPPAPAVMVGD